MHYTKRLILASFLFIFFNARAQDFSLTKFGSESHYVNSLATSKVYQTVKWDSLSVVGSDSIYSVAGSYQPIVPYESANEYLNLSCWFGSTDNLFREGNWLGKSAVVSADGKTCIINGESDSIWVQNQAQKGESWVFYGPASDTHFVASVTNELQDTVFGKGQIIKEVTLICKDGSGVLVPHIFNNRKFALSQDFGLIKSFSFFSFPHDTTYCDLIGLDASQGDHPLSERELYNFNVGDYFRYSISYKLSGDESITRSLIEKKYILAKKEYENKSSYLVCIDQEGVENLWGEINPIKSTKIVKESYDNSIEVSRGERDMYGYIANYWEAGKKHLKTRKCAESTLSMEEMKTEGIGLIEMKDYLYDGEHISENEKNLLEYSQELFQDSLSFDAENLIGHSIILLDSCSAELAFTCSFDEDDEFALDYLWDFGDGATANGRTATHVYGNYGAYMVTVRLNTPGGNVYLRKRIEVYPESNPELILAEVDSSCRSIDFRLDIANGINSLQWFFPDGTVSDEEVSTYDLVSSDSLKVSAKFLWNGCPQLVEAVVLPQIDREVRIEFVLAEECNEVIFFTHTSPDIDSLKWTFVSNGVLEKFTEDTVIYAYEGPLTANLTAHYGVCNSKTTESIGGVGDFYCSSVNCAATINPHLQDERMSFLELYGNLWYDEAGQGETCVQQLLPTDEEFQLLVTAGKSIDSNYWEGAKVRVWLDRNCSGTFGELNELVFTGETKPFDKYEGLAEDTFKVIIPNFNLHKSKNYRMRICVNGGGGLAGCTGTTYDYLVNFYGENVLSLQELTESETNITLYPNPIDERLFFKGDEIPDFVEVWSLDGKLVCSRKIESNFVELETLKGGLYMARVFRGNEQLGIFKIIKN
ncbi:MAG: PKD domain-containing protein [Bacteroidetes bacterium]|nr:MAG: PKD domain-containing protein [Bacteroidota bacterium]